MVIIVNQRRDDDTNNLRIREMLDHARLIKQHIQRLRNISTMHGAMIRISRVVSGLDRLEEVIKFLLVDIKDGD